MSPRLGTSELINTCPITLIFSLNLRREITDAAHFSNSDSIYSELLTSSFVKTDIIDVGGLTNIEIINKTHQKCRVDFDETP